MSSPRSRRRTPTLLWCTALRRSGRKSFSSPISKPFSIAAAFFADLATRLKELAKACRAQGYFVAAPVALIRHIEPHGVMAVEIPPWLDPAETLLFAAACIKSGRVKFCPPTIDKMAIYPLGAALSFKADDPVDAALQGASLAAISLKSYPRRKTAGFPGDVAALRGQCVAEIQPALHETLLSKLTNFHHYARRPRVPLASTICVGAVWWLCWIIEIPSGGQAPQLWRAGLLPRQRERPSEAYSESEGRGGVMIPSAPRMSLIKV